MRIALAISLFFIADVGSSAQSPPSNGQSFLQWVNENGLIGSSAAALASPAGDNVPNLLKFALGLDPTFPAPVDELPSSSLGASGDRTFTYLERSPIQASLQVEASANLFEWQSDSVVELRRTASSKGTLVTVKENLADAPDDVFFRLRVTLPPPPVALSNDPLHPTFLIFGPGNNEVSGQVATPRNTRDFFRFSVPAGRQLTAIYLEEWTAENDNLGYLHLDSGPTTVIPSSATASDFLGGAHVNRALYGPNDNLLLALAGAPQGGTGFPTPLPAGDYVVNVQQTGPEESFYRLRFVLAAEPLPIVQFVVRSSGASSYLIDGSPNASLTLIRGRTYEFQVSASGHPFLIKTTATTGTANTYRDGVTNNGLSSGTLTFTVPPGAPNTLFYICQFHSSMRGTINIVDP